MSRPSDPNARIKLLAAAEAVFVAHGLDEAKVDDIAARAGVSKGSFYLHFDSKEDAFRQLVEMMLLQMKAQIEAWPEDSVDPHGATMTQLLDLWVEQDLGIFEFVWKNRALVGLVLEGGGCAAYRYLIDGFCDEAVDKTKRLLRRGMSAGLYRADLDVDVTALFIGGAYDRLARQIVRQSRRPDLARMLRQVQLLVLAGVASPATLRQLTGVAAGAAPARRARVSPRAEVSKISSRAKVSPRAAPAASQIGRRARKRAGR